MNQQFLLIAFKMSKRKASDSFLQAKSTKRTNSSYTDIKSLAAKSPYKFVDIPKVSQYAAIEKLHLSKEVLEKLKQTLQIEHVSDIQFQHRLKDGNLFINYQQNPFYKQAPQSRFSPLNAQRRAASRSSHNIASVKDKNIIDSINKLKQKKDFENQMNKFTKVEQISNDLHNEITNNQKKYKKSLKTGNKVDFSEYKENVEQKLQIIDDFHDFDRILGMKEENFYRKANESKSHNIFKLIKNYQNSTFQSYQTLKKLHFCQDSTVSRPNFIKIANTFQGLSYIARMMGCGRYHLIPKQYKLVPSDIKAILQELKFRDLIMISSGMINTDVLETYLQNKGISSHKQEQGGSSFIVNERQVLYDEGINHCGTNFIIEHHNKVQIEGYIQETLSQIELKQQRLSEMHKEKLVNLLKQEEICHAKNVHDRYLRSQIKKQIQNVLGKQFKDQIRKQRGTIDKIVRLNKLNKDRIQKIKNIAVIESIKIKKQFENRIRSKSRSPVHSFSVWR